ncbi:hypothetical protein [Dyella silvatica]|nr:hypothetical protein [Dyella silvatica]
MNGPFQPWAEIEAVTWIDPAQGDGLAIAPPSREQMLPLPV